MHFKSCKKNSFIQQARHASSPAKQSSTSKNEFKASRSRSKTGGWGWGALTQWKNVTELAGRTTGKERTVHAGRTDRRLKDARCSGQACVTHTRPAFLSASTLVRHALVPPLLSHLSPTDSVVNPGPRQRHACPFQLGGAATVR